MATTLAFLQDLAVVTGVAALTVLILRRFRFPMVFGLLAAGIIIGPHTPPYSLVTDASSLQTLADLGVVLLLFGLGLEFDLRGLRRNGAAAIVITAVEVLLMFAIGFEVGRALAWSTLDSVFLGAMLSISSTAIIITVLREMGRMNEESSRLLFAVLVLEDIAAILILVIVSGYAATGGLPLRDAALVLGRMAVFLLVLGLFGLALVPRILGHVVRLQRPEILVLTTFALAIAAAVASDMAGFHVGLGAFLMGVLVAESEFAKQIEHQIRPIHDLFTAIFFVAIGTLVDLSILRDYWFPTTIVVLAVIVGKLVSGAVATFLVGYSSSTAMRVGAALAQVGEFSFVIAAVGLSTGTMSPILFSIIVAASALTSFTSPMMIRYDRSLHALARRLAPAYLRTYSQVYLRWVNAVRSERTSPDAIARRERVAVITSGCLLIATLGAALAFHRPLQSRLPVGSFASGLYWGIVLAVTVPLAWLFYRHSRDWIQRLTDLSSDAGTLILRPRNIVLYSFLLLGTILVGLPVVIATLPFLSRPLVAAAWVGAVGAASILLLHRIRRLHARVQGHIESLLKERHLPVTTDHAIELLFKDSLPSSARTETIAVPRDAWLVGKRVGEIEFGRTVGANVILIERGDGRQEVPTAQTTILPGDRLVLIGSNEQVDAARALLARRLPREEILQGVRPGNLFVPADSRLVGASMAQSDLRNRFGLQIIAIRRGTETLVNPMPDTLLRPEDVLVVVGPSHRIVEAERWVQERDAGAGE